MVVFVRRNIDMNCSFSKGKKGDGPPAKKMKVETAEEKALRVR